MFAGVNPFGVCTYAATSIVGTVTNAATGRVAFTGQTLTRQPGSATFCPPPALLNLVVRVLDTSSGAVYVTL